MLKETALQPGEKQERINKSRGAHKASHKSGIPFLVKNSKLPEIKKIVYLYVK